MSHFAKPQKLQKLFNTEAGREAFKTLNDLGQPTWYYGRDKDGGISLIPMIQVRDGAQARLPGPISGESIDAVAIGILKDLKEEASLPGRRVVSNGQREFRYDKTSGSFTPA